MLPKVKIVEVFEELSPQDNGYWEVPDGVYEVEFALVAGGLNGGYSDIYNAGSGGNGGGVLTGTIPVNPGVTYRVVIVYSVYIRLLLVKVEEADMELKGMAMILPREIQGKMDHMFLTTNILTDTLILWALVVDRELIQEDGIQAFYPEVKVAITEEVMELELRILRVLLLMVKMEVMPLIMVVVEEEPLKLLIVGLRAVEEDQVIVVLLFCITLKIDNMNRNDIIKELGSYFDIVELVCPHTYNKWKDRSWQFLDTAFLHNLLILRRDIIKQPMYCNNWDKQGQFSQRGLRCNICQIVKDKKDVYLSAHVLGKAGDFDVKSMTAEQARGLILDHQDMLPYPFRLEGKVGWLHFDSLDTRNGIHAVVF